MSAMNVAFTCLGFLVGAVGALVIFVLLFDRKDK